MNEMDKFATLQAQLDKITKPEEMEVNTQAQASKEEPQAQGQVDAKEDQTAEVKTPAESGAETVESPTPKPDNVLQQKVATLEAEKADLQAKLAQYEAELKKLQAQPQMKDEFIAGLVHRYNSGEDLTPYISAKNTDYASMTHKQLLFESLRRENPRLPKSDLDALYEMELENYKQDDPSKYDEREAERGAILLRIKAEKAREALIEEQKKFLAPPPAEQAVPQDTQQIVEGWIESVNNAPQTKAIKEKKSLPVKYGDNEFHIPVAQSDKIIESIYDLSASEFWAKHLDANGNPDLDKIYDTYNYAFNKETVWTKLIEIGKELGKAEVIEGEEGKNSTLADKSRSATTGIPKTTEKDEMIKELLSMR